MIKTFIAVLAVLPCVAFAAEELKLAATVPLPGVKGRFDHFAADLKAHRLFVAALGNNTLEVIDTMAAKRLHTIPGLHKPCGVAYLAEANQIVVANGDDGTVKVFSGSDYKLTKNITGLDDADNVRADAKANRLYVGYGDGALAVIDGSRLEVVGTVKLKAHPESFQLEQNGPRIFVNLPDAKQIAVVDREKRSVVATWPMEKFRANFPMALDEASKRLIVGCRQPARAVVLNTEDGRMVADFAISGDTDDLFWDAAGKRLYVSCGEGFADVFRDEGGRFERTGHVATRTGARTSFFDSQAKKFFLAVPQRAGGSAELRVYEVE